MQDPFHGAAVADEDRRDGEDFARCMEFVRARAPGEIEGAFGPGSLAWTMMREPGALVGTMPAVLLQLAHPAVADGVAAHSAWERDFIGRARRTFTAMYALVFGSLGEATGAARRLHAVHRRVRGVVEEPGSRWTGRAYRANDQALLGWVAATVIVYTRRAFELFVRPLRDDERARDREEYKVAAALSGVLPEGPFASHERLHTWFEEMLRSDELAVGPRALRIARALHNTALTRGPFDQIIMAALLPDHLREAFELRWGRRERAAFRALRRAVRLGRHLPPGSLHGVVAWHQAHLRLARAHGRQGPLWARVLNAVDRRVDLPTSVRPIASLG